MRQRKLLLPPFHGEAVQRYVQMISDVAEREIDGWPLPGPFALAPRMQAVTLEVIMSGVFGIEGRPLPRDDRATVSAETIRRLLRFSTTPLFQLIELQNASRTEATGILRQMLAIIDRQLFELIRERRAAQERDGDRTDILSLLLQARDENGEPLTDQELRDELLSLVLAGHETTANSLAWIFERLLRTPARLRPSARAGARRRADGAEAYVEATIHEGMRNRPVIPMIVRMVKRPWRFGEYVVPADTPGGGQHRRPAPPRGRVSRAVCVRAGAVPGAQARHLHLDPVRRRHPPLPRCVAGDGRAAGGAVGDRAPHRPGRAGSTSPSAPASAT